MIRSFYFSENFYKSLGLNDTAHIVCYDNGRYCEERCEASLEEARKFKAGCGDPKARIYEIVDVDIKGWGELVDG